MNPAGDDAVPLVAIRPFERADQAAVEAVIQAGMRERWGDAFDPAFNEDVADLWGRYVEQGAEVVVLEVGGVVVGTGTLVDHEDDAGRLVRMSVDGAHRRRGHARAIVDDLVARARRRGNRRVVVLTDTPWPDAVAFYRACGFAVVVEDDVDTWLALDLGPELITDDPT